MPEEDALLQAIEADDARRAVALVRNHPEMATTRDEAGLSALMNALYRGQDEVAVAIRESRSDLDIFEAAALGDVDRIRSLLSDEPSLATAWSADGFTPLHHAAFFGHPDAARELVERGADLEAPSRNRQFALEARPLHSAAAARQTEVCAILLEAGADPNARQHGGFTPLLEAAQHGDSELAEVLLRHGADATLRLDDGRTAADLADQAGAADLAERLRSPRFGPR